MTQTVLEAETGSRLDWRLLRTPVTLFAAAGVTSILMGIWVIGRWLVAGEFHLGFASSEETGASSARMLTIWLYQGVLAVTAVGFAAWGIWQCIRQRRLTFDGSLCLAYLWMFWMAPLLNCWRPILLYNANLVHMPSWGPYIPGWRSVGAQRQIEPLFVSSVGWLSMVIWPITTGLVMGWFILRRWPQLSGIRLTAAAFVCSVLIDWPLEASYIAAGTAHYVGTEPSALTVFSGHWYQFPTLQFIPTTLVFAWIPYLVRHHYKTNGPDSTILRGISLYPARARTTAQTLALIGLMALGIVGVSICEWLVAWYNADGPLPSDLPSYFITVTDTAQP
ncbi:spirocyclase AveC family protein [Nocardia ninae]|uniref:DUF5135 domain-containing protein n=1 Tax=Nocardia ninae NBRC 108245 TaxID=1210091 RepID=A0A511MH24_9NOCA|nr:spirocyclase AveC family protein [Nocardia ninae]GEM39964.1 hypothetical protein NN4_44830 [Nocardia ninae NBRC 108245]